MATTCEDGYTMATTWEEFPGGDEESFESLLSKLAAENGCAP